MPNGWKSGGVEIDTLFMARVNTKRADVNLDYNNSDMSNVFEPIGDGTPRANVNIKSNNIDIAQLFRDITDPLATVTVSGETIVSSTAFIPAKAGVRFNSDGTVDKRSSDSYVQIDSSTDWIIPNGSASSDYDIRITNVSWTSGSSFDVSAASENTWINLGSAREWSVWDTNPTGGVGQKAVSFTVEIRDGDGVTQDSATYSLSADYEEIT